MAKDAADGMVDLLSAQIRLARLELAADARSTVQGIVKTALFALPVLVGYVFLMGAAASALSRFWGWTLALLVTSAAQIVIGATGLRWSVKTLRSVHPLSRSSAEAATTVQGALTAVSKPMNGEAASARPSLGSLTPDPSRRTTEVK